MEEEGQHDEKEGQLEEKEGQQVQEELAQRQERPLPHQQQRPPQAAGHWELGAPERDPWQCLRLCGSSSRARRRRPLGALQTLSR